MTEVYVYVIGRENGPIKVGISRDPRRRMMALQGGCPFRLKLLHKVEARNTDHAHAIEQAFHGLWRSRRITGEWFNLCLEDAILDLETCFGVHEHFRKRAEMEGIEWQG